MRHTIAVLAVLLIAAGAAADDFEVDPVEPDFTVITLPTTLRLPSRTLAFRVTHRFARPLNEGDFGSLASDLFGLDGAAQVGLELRFAPLPGTQLGVYRTSDRTISLFVQQDMWRARDRAFGLALAASLEGANNLRQDYSPQVGLVLSRRLGTRGAVYVEPRFVGNARPDGAAGEGDSSWPLGLGARLRLREKLSLLAEVHPRLFGFAGGNAPLTTFGIERRVGGHCFELNVSNALGTTPAQVARGRSGGHDWLLGFNISRKFY